MQLSKSLTLREGKLLLAYSGGSDSTALLYILSKEAKGRVEAFYINHRIRSKEEIEEEVKIARNNSLKLGVPFIYSSLEEKEVEKIAHQNATSIESAARILRYNLLTKYARLNGFSAILTAHHKLDQAETVIMRLLSSSPVWALSGIEEENGLIMRPILSWSKEEIMEVLNQSDLEWSYDSTNSLNKYLRNDIRSSLIPALSKDTIDILCKISSNISSFKKKYKILSFSDMGLYKTIKKETFFSSPVFRREEAIYNAIEKRDRIPRSFIVNFLEKAEKGEGRLEFSSFWIYFTKTEIKIFKKIDNFNFFLSSFPLTLSENLVIKNEKEDEKTLSISFWDLFPPLVIRTSREADIIELKEGKKKIRDLEKEMKIPYSVILEDRKGIRAYFSRFLGGKDRLEKTLIGKKGEFTAVSVLI